MAAGEEIGAPDLAAGVGEIRGEDDEGGEVLVDGAQAVAGPGAQGGAGDADGTGVDAEGGLEVIVVIAVHGADEADVVHAVAEVGEEVADLGAALAAGLEVPEGAEVVAFGIVGGGFAVIGGEAGLGVEGVHVGDAAAHVEEDDAFGFGGEMGGAGGEGVGGIKAGVGGEELLEDAGKEQGAGGERAEDGAAGGCGLHGWVLPSRRKRTRCC